MKENFIELVKYGIFGCLTTVINYILFVFFCKIGINYVISNSISYFIAVVLSYYLNEKFVFKADKGNRVKQIIRYIINRVSLIVVDNILLVVLVEWVKITPTISKILVTVVLLLANYFISKVYVFGGENENG